MSSNRELIWSTLTLGVLVGCGAAPDTRPAGMADAPPSSRGAASDATPGPPSSSAVPDDSDPRPLVVFLGDSLTAGFGLAEDLAFPALVRAELERRGTPARVVNAGVSGDTTAGGLARLDWLLAQQPDVLVVALGANDGLRGLDLEHTEAKLRAIVAAALAAGARPLLAGMLIPPNYGADYASRFAGIFPRLARELDVPLVPFLLAGVAGVPELNQADGIHPNAAGQARLAQSVAPYVLELLRSPEPGRETTPDDDAR